MPPTVVVVVVVVAVAVAVAATFTAAAVSTTAVVAAAEAPARALPLPRRRVGTCFVPPCLARELVEAGAPSAVEAAEASPPASHTSEGCCRRSGAKEAA